MAWELSSKGFLMTLSGYVADLIEEDFDTLVQSALEGSGLNKADITHWCIHPGGKKILESIHKSLGFANGQLQYSYDVLRDYGNMSSPTVLFILDRLRAHDSALPCVVMAFGPGLSIEAALFV